MPVTWKEGFNPDIVARLIEETRKLQDDGTVKFEGWFFREHEVLLSSMLKFPDEIPENVSRNISSRIIFNTGSRGKISVVALLNEARKLTREYLELPVRKYVLVTSISLDPNIGLSRIYIGKKQIIFEKKLPKRFSKSREEILELAKNSLFAPYPQNYMNVRIHISARSVFEATDDALGSIDYIRGIWNLSINGQEYFRWSSGKPLPVNKIILGPIHSLHEPSGKLATDNRWWYEPSYLGSITLFNPLRYPNFDMVKRFNRSKYQLGKKQYKNAIILSILRYTRSLDERNWGTSFLKLWSVLEYLTDTSFGNYDLTIKRAVFLYPDTEFQTQIMQQLRKYRNDWVHNSEENCEIETYLYQIKRIVEDLINFYAGTKFKFGSLQEAASFLSLPCNNSSLIRKSELLNYAMSIKLQKHK